MAITSVIFTINGHTYTNDESNLTVPEGYRFIGYGWVPALANLVVDILVVAGQVLTNATAAGGSANAASASASAAAASAATAVNAPGTSATSATALTVSTGAKSLVIQPGKSIPPAGKVLISRTSDPVAWWMYGTVTAHDPNTGALTVQVSRAEGSGAASDWSVLVTGIEGLQGLPGDQGQSGVIPWVRISASSTLSTAPAKAAVNSSAAAIDLTLDPALPDLSEITLKDIKGAFGTNRCRLYPGADRTIMGAAFLDLTINYAEYHLVLDGTDWRI